MINLKTLIIFLLLNNFEKISAQSKFALIPEVSLIELQNSEYSKHYRYFSDIERYNYSRVCYQLSFGLSRSDTWKTIPIHKVYSIGFQRRNMGFLIVGSSADSISRGGDFHYSANYALAKQQWSIQLYGHWYLGVFLDEKLRINHNFSDSVGMQNFGMYDISEDRFYIQRFEISKGLTFGYLKPNKWRIDIQYGETLWKVVRPTDTPFSKLNTIILQGTFLF